jgi:anti-sigma regulatory factor (Ser/Thr protein kinase)
MNSSARSATASAVTAGAVPVRGCSRAYRAFSATAASVPGVRSWVRNYLVRAGVEPEVTGRAELLVSELATNAVQHAHGVRVMVSVEADHHVEAAVRDDDAALPLPRQAGPWDTGGRGLALVDALSDAWGSRPAGTGKWVWFRVERHAT